MKFEFYVDDQNGEYVELYCKDESGRFFRFDTSWHNLAKWKQIAKPSCELKKISEEKAQKIVMAKCILQKCGLTANIGKKYIIICLNFQIHNTTSLFYLRT